MHPPIGILFHWLHNTPEILKQLCVIVVVAYLAIRVKWLRQAIKGSAKDWRLCLITTLFFGGLAVLGSLNAIVVDIHDNNAIKQAGFYTNRLNTTHALIGFRDTMALSAGLSAGPWVGLGAGLIAGYHRYSLGGFVGTASGLATLLLGLGAGFARQFWPNATNLSGTLVVALMGTALHRILILQLAESGTDAITLTWETLIPVTVVNCFGCLTFRSVMKDLERDHLEVEMKQQLLERKLLTFQKKQAEFRALQAQVEPHFINNTLNAIKALIRINPERASEYIVKLARFLDETRQMAKANSISLGEELRHLENYLDFQYLRFPDAFNFQASIPPELSNYQIPPRCLLTLAENALLHGKRGHVGCLSITLSGIDNGLNLALQLQDNGCGMPKERVDSLCKQPVVSERGSGNGLYQLQESLQLAFDGASKLAIYSQPGAGTKITLILPKRSEPW